MYAAPRGLFFTVHLLFLPLFCDALETFGYVMSSTETFTRALLATSILGEFSNAGLQ